MTIGERIRKKRIEQGITLEELGKAAGVNRATIHRYETGTIVNIPTNNIEAISRVLKVSPGYIMGWEDENDSIIADNILKVPGVGKKIPLLGTISAGEPLLATENIEEYFEINEFTEADFCLRVRGDSMINAQIYDGDIIFIKKQSTVDDGEIAAVLIEDEATLKKVFKFGDYVQLRAENPRYEPIDLDDSNSVYILGKATYKLSDI